MKREELKFENIKKDLEHVAYSTNYNISHRWGYGVFVAPIGAILAFFVYKLLAIPFVIFSVYSLIRYIPEARENKRDMKNISDALERCDFSVSIEKLSHIADETVYEGHDGLRHSSHTREDRYYHFYSGLSWKEPNVSEHYEWSKDFSLSSKGLSQTSVEGNEFYYVTLKGASNAAYIYNTKFFVLKENDSENKSENV